jgi:hypothetical protein
MVRVSVPRTPEETASGCLWCATELGEERTKEHVFPRWLLREFNLAAELVAPTHVSESLDPVSRRQHRLAALVEGRVCAACNGGWMSALEVAVRPILSPLMRGSRALVSLNHEERRVLARWAVKTAYNLNWSANYPRKVPLDHLRELRSSDDLPAQVVVLAASHEGESEMYWLQGPTWPVELAGTGREEAAAMAARSYKIGLHLGQLILLVAWWPSTKWIYRILPSLHRTLWPTFGLWALGQGEPEIELKSPQDYFVAFHVFLGIVEDGAIDQEPFVLGAPVE